MHTLPVRGVLLSYVFDVVSRLVRCNISNASKLPHAPSRSIEQWWDFFFSPNNQITPTQNRQMSAKYIPGNGKKLCEMKWQTYKMVREFSFITVIKFQN